MSSDRLACVLVAAALDVETVTVGDDMQSVAAWDSLGHMAIVAELEKQLGVALTPEQIVSIVSVRDIAKLLGETMESQASGPGNPDATWVARTSRST